MMLSRGGFVLIVSQQNAVVVGPRQSAWIAGLVAAQSCR